MTPGFVPPLYGTRRRTREEWLDAGGDPKRLKRDDPWWPTLGHEVGDVARRIGLPPMPHQQYIFDVAAELDPDPEFGDVDELWYAEVDVWVMRQCGKTMGIIFVLILHRLVRMSKKKGYGRQLATFTMQDRNETRKKLELDMIPLLQESPATESFREITNTRAKPGRSTREWKQSLRNGSEHLLFGRGNYMLIETPSPKAGHGGTVDVKAGDEVRFGVDDRLEASAASQITRRSRQLLVGSTAGNEKSLYMWPKVVGGRKRIKRDDRETRVCSFEWAIPLDADLHDPLTWITFHPAVGHTQKVTDLLDLLRTAEDSPDERKIETFRNEYANQWMSTPLLGPGDRVFIIQPDEWAKAHENAGGFVGPTTIGVDVHPHGRSATIARAGRNQTGRIQVDVHHWAAGTFWFEGELAAAVREFDPVAIAYTTVGGSLSMAGAIDRASGDTDKVKKIGGTEYAAACEAFRAGIAEDRYAHRDQEWLNAALEDAVKKVRGTGWIWDGAGEDSDITPLPAVTCAVRALEMNPEPQGPQELTGSLMA